MNFQKHLIQYISNPRNPEYNFKLGIEYFSLKQYAASLSYLLRCAELHDDKDVVYECLIKIWQCFNNVGRRQKSAIAQLEQAINMHPTRPEAFFLMCTVYEKEKEWFKCYHYANLGLALCRENHKPLRTDVGYLGKTSIEFMKAVSSWYVGQRKQSKELTLEHFINKQTPENLKEVSKGNLKFLGYSEEQIKKLNFNLKSVRSIE